MKRWNWIVFATLLPSLVMAVGQWEVFETSFESSKSYENPFTDVQVDVVFEKGGTRWKVPAFWDGETDWMTVSLCSEGGSKN